MFELNFKEDINDLRKQRGFLISYQDGRMFIQTYTQSDIVPITIILDRYMLSYEFGKKEDMFWFYVLTKGV